MIILNLSGKSVENLFFYRSDRTRVISENALPDLLFNKYKKNNYACPIVPPKFIGNPVGSD